MDNFCVIFADGDYMPRKKYSKADFVISTIDGFYKAEKLGITPDAVIGDFSSVSDGKTLDTDAFVVKITREKTDTDILGAIKVGLRRGFTSFIIYGSADGSLGSAFANISVLQYLNAYSARGYLIDGDAVATVITDGKLTLPKTADGKVSIFAYGGTASSVTTKNLESNFDNTELDPALPVGASNCVSYKQNSEAKAKAEISVKHGSLLIFFPRP